jgi:hypothetical protein
LTTIERDWPAIRTVGIAMGTTSKKEA